MRGLKLLALCTTAIWVAASFTASAGCFVACVTVSPPRLTSNPLQPIQPGPIAITPQGGSSVTLGPTPAPSLTPSHPPVAVEGNSEFAEAVNKANGVAEAAENYTRDHIHIQIDGSGLLGGGNRLHEGEDEDGEEDVEDDTSTCGPCMTKPTPAREMPSAPPRWQPTPVTIPPPKPTGATMEQARPPIIPPSARGIPMSAPSPLDEYPGGDAPTREEMNPRTEPGLPRTAVPTQPIE